uniref:EamA domain-containing protein n=1 Tax=Haptolina brevifila TaxID=156173 RepID=A0A7S2GGV1_9EUKA|mmetsp:Transcript_34811/g.69390  ORF Transcript_34811/g.69390 Transcript_34811/m.69390 type:complete len:371 (+) Transcript_34811:115-1227(+)
MGSEVLGWIEVLIATVFFGSNFVPVKRYETHDGMYFQWIMCSAIFIVGLIVQLFLFAAPPTGDQAGLNSTALSQFNSTELLLLGRPDPYSVKFFPFAAFGGALWATGNTLSVPAINYIGLSLGLLIWGSGNMLMGWATGAFGLFTGHKDDYKPTLNYIGVALAVIALFMYTGIKTTDPAKSNKVMSSDTRADQMNDILLDNQPAEPVEAPKQSAAAKKIIGILMAITAGVMFGNTFTPPNVILYAKHGPQSSIDYVFSHFCGIFATSTFWFMVYCCVMKGHPLINPRLTLPAFVSGLMWAIAQTCWFLATEALGGVSISFPIITSGPGIISALWGVFVFHEIQGRRNYLILCTAILTAVIGCILIALSKG